MKADLKTSKEKRQLISRYRYQGKEKERVGRIMSGTNNYSEGGRGRDGTGDGSKRRDLVVGMQMRESEMSVRAPFGWSFLCISRSPSHRQLNSPRAVDTNTFNHYSRNIPSKREQEE